MVVTTRPLGEVERGGTVRGSVLNVEHHSTRTPHSQDIFGPAGG